MNAQSQKSVFFFYFSRFIQRVLRSITVATLNFNMKIVWPEWSFVIILFLCSSWLQMQFVKFSFLLMIYNGKIANNNVERKLLRAKVSD